MSALDYVISDIFAFIHARVAAGHASLFTLTQPASILRPRTSHNTGPCIWCNAPAIFIIAAAARGWRQYGYSQITGHARHFIVLFASWPRFRSVATTILFIGYLLRRAKWRHHDTACAWAYTYRFGPLDTTLIFTYRYELPVNSIDFDDADGQLETFDIFAHIHVAVAGYPLLLQP